MNLNPQKALDQLIRRRLGFERGRGGRTEEAQALQAAINRGEIEVSNLSRQMGDDYQLNNLFRQLHFELEMGRGVLRQRSPQRR